MPARGIVLCLHALSSPARSFGGAGHERPDLPDRPRSAPPVCLCKQVGGECKSPARYRRLAGNRKVGALGAPASERIDQPHRASRRQFRGRRDDGIRIDAEVVVEVGDGAGLAKMLHPKRDCLVPGDRAKP